MRATLFGLAYNVAQLCFGASAPLIEDAIVDVLQRAGASRWSAHASPALWCIATATFPLVALGVYRWRVRLGLMAPTTTGRSAM